MPSASANSTARSKPWTVRASRLQAARSSNVAGRTSWPGIVTPMAGGILRPTVFLPRAAMGWSSDRRDVVLTHEIAHLFSEFSAGDVAPGELKRELERVMSTYVVAVKPWMRTPDVTRFKVSSSNDIIDMPPLAIVLRSPRAMAPS